MVRKSNARRFPRLADAAPAPAVPIPSRGRLYYDYEIADAFFNGLPKITEKVRWIRSHLPRSKRVKIGRDSAWYEADILAYRESLQGARQAVAS